MPTIDNPNHSRPLDVHRWSDHPEVKALVEKLWGEHQLGTSSAEQGGKPRTGPKPATPTIKQLRVLILDLYVAWLEDPELSIGVSMSPNHWKTNTRYNALHLSKKLIPLINTLREVGLLDLAPGSYAGSGAKGNRTTRIRAAEPLQAMFRKAKFARDDVTRFDGEETIILRDEKDANRAGKQVEYQDTETTTTMRQELQSYNELLAASFIDIATLQEPVIRVEAERESPDIQIHRDHSRVRRIFSRSNWEMNGRFYGGWWQRVNDDWRSKIFINDQPTVEVDFKGLHVAMLYARAGQAMEHDPYELPGTKMSETETVYLGYPAELARKLCKKLALTAINAKEKSSAYRAFREGFPAQHFAKRLTNAQLDKFLDCFLQRNPALTDSLFSDEGIRLMYLDSQITAHIHRHFTEQDIPVLSVHDSYIIDHMKVAELRRVMAEASEAIVGRALPTAIKLPDAPEYEFVSDEQLQEYIENRVKGRCMGHMERVFRYQERTGRRICPVVKGDARLDYALSLE